MPTLITIAIIWLIYEKISQVVAEVKAKQMHDAYKKLRDIAEGKSKGNRE